MQPGTVMRQASLVTFEQRGGTAADAEMEGGREGVQLITVDAQWMHTLGRPAVAAEHMQVGE